MNLASQRRRFWILLALAMPLTSILAAGFLNAQQPPFPKPPQPGGGFMPPNNPGGGFKPPNMPSGQIQIPKIERVWTCGKCGKEIGKGAWPPATCPFCGTKLINGVGNGGDNPFQGNGGLPAGNAGSGSGGIVPPASGGQVGSPPPGGSKPFIPPVTTVPPPPGDATNGGNANRSSETGGRRLGLIIAAVVVIGLLFLTAVAGVGCFLIWMFVFNAGKPTQRKKRRPDSDPLRRPESKSIRIGTRNADGTRNG